MATRSAQRNRTREALLAGARALISRGQAVTVAAAAAEAGISRPTAYRYFSDPGLLVSEAGLAVKVLAYEEVTGRAATLQGKLAAITLYFFDLACEHEVGFRQFLARNLDVSLSSERTSGPSRGARRVAMLERALEESDVALSASERRRIVCSLSVITGVETMVALYDVVGADRVLARQTVQELADLVIGRHLPSH